MKITNYNINNKLNTDNKTLKEGMTIKARILEVNDSNVKILLENGEVLEAKTLINMEELKNKLTTFFIKSFGDGKLILSLANNEDLNLIGHSNANLDEAAEAFLNNILITNNLPNNEKSLQLLKSMVKFKLPLNRENIDGLIKILDKIDGLAGIGEDERIYTVKSTKSPTSENIMKFMKISQNIGGHNVEIDSNLKPLNMDNGMVNNSQEEAVLFDVTENTNNSQDKVGLFDITENANNTQGKVELVDVTEIIKPKLETIFLNNMSKEALINKIVFLSKLGMDMTLENIEKINSLIDNNEGLVKPLIELLTYLNGNEQELDGISEESKNLNLELIKVGKENKLSKEDVKDFFRSFKEVIDQLPDHIKSNKSLFKELETRLDNFLSKLELESKMNHYYTFIHIPIEFSKEKDNSNLIIAKKKNRLNNNNYSVYISLNTKSLKKVEVYCNISYEEVQADFIIEKEYREYFINRFKVLSKSLNSLGFEKIKLNIKDKDEEENMLNLFLENDLPNYNLNIRV